MKQRSSPPVGWHDELTETSRRGGRLILVGPNG
jgi:hypothetical protein